MTENISLGFVISPSTSSQVSVSAWSDNNNVGVVGKMVYVDQSIDGENYRALGTVTDTLTTNSVMTSGTSLAATANTRNNAFSGSDLKTYEIKIQSVYRQGEEGWKQAGSGFPISPDTRQDVYGLDNNIINEIIQDKADDVVYVGNFRGIENSPAPLVLSGFNTKRGATHSAIIGRSGTGKTGFGQTLLLAQMKNEGHAIIVIDPQGQWSNEVGFLFSLQKAAQNLGREVKVLRVSEDIRLPQSSSLLAHFMEETRLWSALQRMADDNRYALSQEVSKKAISVLKENPNSSPKDILFKAFSDIAKSRAIMGRIYARGGEQGENLRRLFCFLTDQPFINKNEEEEIPTPEDLADASETWDSILNKFTPLINLFMKENLSGGPRVSLHSALSGILKVRGDGEVAPYVILDMSSDTALSSRANYAALTGVTSDTATLLNMRNMLDNQEIKAHIVSTILDEVKHRAEEAFSNDGGLLDTQIVFDEAWRFAPRPGDVTKGSAIKDLTDKLAGFALDTRKYGIGWTYILQVPSGLNETIWKQLTYVYSGYGMVGSDKRMLTDLMDDPNQMRLYDQFSSPQSTNVYPFMITGPVSPLIFTAAPVFVNVFNTVEDMLSSNAHWLDAVCDRNGLPRFSNNPESISVSKPSSPLKTTVLTPPVTQGASKKRSPIVPVKSYSGVETSKRDLIDDLPF